MDHADIRNALDVWPQLFENAKNSIYLETYYIADSIPDEIINSIKNVASKGVNVKIILDEGMYSKNQTKPDVLNLHENIEVRTLPVKTMSGGWLHAKYFIIDNEVAYIGSQNWSWTALNDSLEVGVLVRSPALCAALLSVFEADWIKSGGSPLLSAENDDSDNDGWPDPYESWLGTDPLRADTDNDGAIDSRDPNPFVQLSTIVQGSKVKWLRLVETPPVPELDNPYIQNTENALCELIGSATKTIRAMLYYYTTGGNYTTLDNAFREAAARGVRVEVLVSDKYFKQWRHSRDALLDLAAVQNITVKTIDIEGIGLSGTSGWLHTKTLFVDDERAYVGSANWFAPHMGHQVTLDGWQPGPTREVGLVFESPRVVGVLTEIFTRAWASDYARPVLTEEFDWVPVAGAASALIALLAAVILGRGFRGLGRWYLYQEGKRYGPVSTALLRRWIEERRVKEGALIWRKGMKDWKNVFETEPFKRKTTSTRTCHISANEN
ncbi:MAG: phospholipase D-like domain-containing protein [Hadesarchaea archaeon]|nr:phospholipase D-like domain-containing protein [Hadesarchaea archaeon]